jgi:hypothetical protein
MFGDLIHRIEERRRRRLEAHNDTQFAPETQAATPSRMRALATGAALATSLDASPAVVVGIYDYAHRYRDRGRRSA